MSAAVQYGLINQCEPCAGAHIVRPAQAPQLVAAAARVQTHVAQASVAQEAPPRPSAFAQSLQAYNAAVLGKESSVKARATMSGWSSGKATY